VLDALERHQPAIRAAYPNAQGMGHDQRTGEFVLMLKGDIEESRILRIDAEVELLTAVPCVSAHLIGRTATSVWKVAHGWSASIRQTAAPMPAPPALS
jgi:hypothetical protein